MSKTFVVQYQTKNAEAAEKNQRLVENVFAQLHADDPGGVRYASFRLADGMTFVHVAIHENDDNVLATLSAFDEFQRDIADRIEGSPAVNEATLVGSYQLTEK